MPYTGSKFCWTQIVGIIEIIYLKVLLAEPYVINMLFERKRHYKLFFCFLRLFNIVTLNQDAKMKRRDSIRAQDD